jgi:hypothetical protein
MAYADTVALKAHMRIPAGSDVDDVELQRALDTASRQIDHLCSRTFEAAQAPATVRFSSPWWDSYGNRWRVPIDDLMTETDLAVLAWTEADEDWTTPVTVSRLLPINAEALGMPWNELVLAADTSLPHPSWHGWASDDSDEYLMITARWGWTEVPTQVAEACILQAARLVKRRDAVFGIAAAPDGSSGGRLQDRMDVDAIGALKGLIKYWGAR